MTQPKVNANWLWLTLPAFMAGGIVEYDPNRLGKLYIEQVNQVCEECGARASGDRVIVEHGMEYHPCENVQAAVGLRKAKVG